jgi:glycosyltransferase involved in cell wall biosynthesis
MMRIGILAEGFAEWQGGIDFLRTICDSLRLGFAAEMPDLVLLYPRRPTLAAVDQVSLPWRKWLGESVREGRVKPWRELLRRQVEESSFARIARLREAVGELPALRFRDDEDLDGVARRERLDCLLPSFRALASCVRTPWVGYLYDFQHRHLPHLFSAEDRQGRDARFVLMAKHARQIIVNSRAVADDCRHFLGEGGAKLVALPFGAAPMPDWLAERPDLLAKYELPKRYFLVSNQFWTHKNHRQVFAALRQLGEAPEAADAAVVCTGSTADWRDPGYFPSLERFLDENGLASKVRILGHIPKRDQIEIMKGALAVIQPTLFEGGPGGGAVYDAVSLGVPALVSDIPVNRELDGLGLAVEFFDPHDDAALSGLMLEHLRRPAAMRQDVATLAAQGRERRRAVGKVLAETIAAVTSGARQ